MSVKRALTGQLAGVEIEFPLLRSGVSGAISIMAHDREKGSKFTVSPHNIKHVLAKFHILEREFVASYKSA
jgi:hypothetical protein